MPSINRREVLRRGAAALGGIRRGERDHEPRRNADEALTPTNQAPRPWDRNPALTGRKTRPGIWRNYYYTQGQKKKLCTGFLC